MPLFWFIIEGYIHIIYTFYLLEIANVPEAVIVYVNKCHA